MVRIRKYHYTFHYRKDSYAHKNISKITEEQEQHILDILCFFPVVLPKKIAYWLCNTREEIAELTNDAPTNGLFCWNDDHPENVNIYAVYNETMQCTGYHEETHAVTHFLNEPSSSALAEGVVACMDKKWWGIDIHLCTYLYFLTENYVSVKALICDKQANDDEFFWSVNCAISYPIMGTFVNFLLTQKENSQSSFLNLYAYQGDNWKEEIEKIYNCTFSELEAEFLDYINHKNYTEDEIAFGKKKLGLQ